MILPAVKKITEENAFCNVPEKMMYCYDCELGRLGAEAFASFTVGAEKADADAFVEFFLDRSLEMIDEIYSVTVLPNKIRVGFRDARGAVNGAASAALLLRKNRVSCCNIVDYPSCSYRSVLLDLARGLPDIEDVERAVRYMALAKYNRVHLHLIDSNGPCYVSDAVPNFKYRAPAGDRAANNYAQFDKKILEEIAELCDHYAIEIVPEIEIPAHGYALCEAHPEFKCQVNDAHSWTICPGNDDIWDFFKKLIGEVIEIFPNSQYVHIGTDELEFLDLAEPRLCHWADCPRCAALRAREGLADRQAEFYYLVDRMHEIVTSYDKKMIMWNDQIDISKDVPISRDILIEFWRIASPGRGPHEGCTFNKFLEKGFRMINANYPSTYLDKETYLSPEKMRTWTPFNVPEQTPEYADQVIGGEACAWELGNYQEYPFYRYTLPPAIALVGDKLWGLGEREHNDDFKEALSEFVFGSSAYVDVFKCVGDLIPPRSNERFSYVLPEEIDREILAKMLGKLQSNSESDAIEAYAWLLQKITDTVNV